ncbi:MAG: hypothetical protein J0I42_00865 [Bosea sp.]|uniref:hypothetical protein n=1 Tax=Bosea sp. (in: a-proteobacteria) TaxID=1871050 RepID=UPI001AC2D412|nr:hypothetical protein [Bosea sp. (in: a-proteobacteria)]MBN9450474.1 hypothetical protein [Bosea sp. (in: a-proteobacteria)]
MSLVKKITLQPGEWTPLEITMTWQVIGQKAVRYTFGWFPPEGNKTIDNLVAPDAATPYFVTQDFDRSTSKHPYYLWSPNAYFMPDGNEPVDVVYL